MPLKKSTSKKAFGKNVATEMKAGKLFVCAGCDNLIREIEGYVWHPKCKEKGEDEPLKQNDHAVDALRYAINTHKPSRFDQEEYNRKLENQMKQLKNINGARHPNDYGFR